MDSMTPEQRLLDIIKRAQEKIRLKKELKIFTKVNIILASVIILISVIFIIDVVTFDYKVPEVDTDDVDSAQENIVPYISEKPKIEKTKADTIPDPEEKEPSFSDLVLLGIISGDEEQAVIEDKTLDKTFFLYTGDKFGDFTLRDISDGSVTIDHNGDKIELRI